VKRALRPLHPHAIREAASVERAGAVAAARVGVRILAGGAGAEVPRGLFPTAGREAAGIAPRAKAKRPRRSVQT
jgi:hypothetical protein